MFVCLVCMFVCFVCWLDCLLACLLCLFVCLFVCFLFACLLVCLFVCLFVCVFLCVLVCVVLLCLFLLVVVFFVFIGLLWFGSACLFVQAAWYGCLVPVSCHVYVAVLSWSAFPLGFSCCDGLARGQLPAFGHHVRHHDQPRARESYFVSLLDRSCIIAPIQTHRVSFFVV